MTSILDFYGSDWKVVEAETLGIPDFRCFSFRYDIMGVNTATKPFMFRYLFDELGYEVALYFDPDIQIFAPLDVVLQKLKDGASFVLTPHLCAPSERTDGPNDFTIMRAGTYNLGFLGAARGAESGVSSTGGRVASVSTASALRIRRSSSIRNLWTSNRDFHRMHMFLMISA